MLFCACSTETCEGRWFIYTIDSYLILPHPLSNAVVIALNFVPNVYGVYVNKTLAAAVDVFASYWLRGRGRTLPSVDTMPVFAATVIR
jgi:hypothetical protein